MNDIHYTTDLSPINWQQLKDRLQEDGFDNGRSLEQYRHSFHNSHTCVLAFSGTDIIGTVRVLSDGVCNAYIVDVWTYRPFRKRGIATRMMELAMQRLPGQHVCLFTGDAVPFYATLGFAAQDTGMGRVVGAWLVNQSR